MSKQGFLSLEYIVGDQTYWLESDFEASPRFSFRIIPLAQFVGHVLRGDMHICKETDYSEIKRTEAGLLFKASQKDDPTAITVDVDSFPSLGWNETFDTLVKVGVPLVDLTGFWHQHIVKGVPGAPEWIDQTKTYWMSAWLPDQQEPLYAVFRDDYKLPGNPTATTVMCENQVAFLERLRWFRVHAISFVAKRDKYWLV